jgi:hypothetical protein
MIAQNNAALFPPLSDSSRTQEGGYGLMALPWAVATEIAEQVPLLNGATLLDPPKQPRHFPTEKGLVPTLLHNSLHFGRAT